MRERERGRDEAGVKILEIDFGQVRQRTRSVAFLLCAFFPPRREKSKFRVGIKPKQQHGRGTRRDFYAAL